MKCKNDPKRSYSGTEPSPKGLGFCAHAEKVGKKATGKDGREWQVQTDKNGTKSWKPVSGASKAGTASKASVAKLVDRINWRTTNPASSANMGWDDNDNPIPMDKDVWNYEPGFRAGDRAAIAFAAGVPPFTVPIKGKSIRDLFRSIERGMRAKVKVTKENSVFMESFLPSHVDGAKFARMYVSGTLTPHDFIVDTYDFYEGGLRRSGNVWEFGLGS